MNHRTFPLCHTGALPLLILPVLALLAASPAAAQVIFPPVYPTLPYMQPPGSSSYSCAKTFSGGNACRITSGPLTGWSGLTVPDPATGGTKGLVLGPQGQELFCQFIPNGWGGLIPHCQPTQPTISGTPEPTFPMNPRPAPTGRQAATEVPLRRDLHGMWTLPATLNATTTLRFTLDSGATNVVIPRRVAAKMMLDGSLTQADFVGNGSATLADGSRIPNKHVILRTITVGGVTVRNVVCSVGPEGSSLLLGESWLHKFRSVSIDNARGVLRLQS